MNFTTLQSPEALFSFFFSKKFDEKKGDLLFLPGTGNVYLDGFTIASSNRFSVGTNLSSLTNKNVVSHYGHRFRERYIHLGI